MKTKGIIKRAIFAIIIIFLCITALYVRHTHSITQNFFNTYYPDTAWTMAVYCGIGMFLNKGEKFNLIASLSFSYLIEISQLFTFPVLVALRSTTIGGLILGYGFLWSDILCYTAGAIICFVIEYATKLILNKQEVQK